MPGLNGRPLAPAARKQGPMPLTQTATTGPFACSRSSEQMLVKSHHHTPSASCSAQPGRGNDSPCGLSATAITLPSGLASTPLELEVPKSTPSKSSSLLFLMPWLIQLLQYSRPYKGLPGSHQERPLRATIGPLL